MLHVDLTKMLELSKGDALRARKRYIERLDETSKEIERHFQEMDLTNTNIDDDMYMLMLQSMAVCAGAKAKLNSTNFKSIGDN